MLIWKGDIEEDTLEIIEDQEQTKKVDTWDNFIHFWRVLIDLGFKDITPIDMEYNWERYIPVDKKYFSVHLHRELQGRPFGLYLTILLKNIPTYERFFIQIPPCP